LWNDAVQAVAVGAQALVVFAGGAFALYQYRQGQRQQHARWLVELSDRFYRDEAHRRVRGKLSDRDEPVAVDELFNDSEVTDYLNFFELIAHLVLDKQLRWKDVEVMFDWWLNDIRLYPNLKESLGKRPEGYGFEKLKELLRVHDG
jgi:hypothetical protein